MIDLYPGSTLANSMDLTAQTLGFHIERGTITVPTARIIRSRALEHAWDASSDPALNALGFSALVPAADDLALVDLKDRSQYVCPARSSAHLGHYDGVRNLGFVRDRRIAFHHVAAIVRIGYLDAVRFREGANEQRVSTEAALATIASCSLDAAAKNLLTDATQARSAYSLDHDERAAGLSVNPLEYTVYTVDPEPIVTDVATSQIIRRFRFTTDEISPSTTQIELASLDELAAAAAV
ncbi:hypothetical protein [Gordonia sp. (in: high G+C Gram-positive bacteria)]|uniref:hypothetical protein n=1 Tax=Gordonia sp. (in: high G+C Gram-positive bacteria) TaxID=84139 RepID=UPI0039E5F1D5